MNRIRAILKNKLLRTILVILIIIATLVVFTNYLFTHPEVITLLLSLPPAVLMLLAIAYIGTIVANAYVLSVSLKMIGKKVHFAENVSLTGYSSVVNFFGPLQSGPGFRAAYLKKRHGVSLRSFLYATVVFYGFFAVINTLILLIALLLRPINSLLVTSMALAATIAVLAALMAYKKNARARELLRSVKLTSAYFWLIGAGALFLSLCTAGAYYIELIYVDPTVNALQAVVYAAAANLALFVSLTPGAIGFRESFLVLSQQLHQIPTNVILSASIIDRAFYVIFLLLLFVVLLLFGARTKLLRSSHSS